MPTRSGSKESLARAINSILQGASNRADVEILLRVDDDNPTRAVDAIELLGDQPGTVIVGPRGAGYIDMGMFVDDLAKAADSHWSWLVDDDAWIEGPWYDALRSMPQDGARAFNASTYCLGPSRYELHGGPVGLILPTGVVKELKHSNPVDDQWLSVVRQRNWPLQHLAGVTYHHDGRAR